ncbi:8-amino-7-oxononanoate synthase [Rhodoblastus acidophilus]|uniref:8-amino-7-oxononanoate synthase n=1 Tax=Candidatus Rhodoblastus alkanivorans TaxID=2954117 RepID=A0ABS9Z6T3_9HYPH|nr:8-amino-7-oxononanoate synthase [Candidatus Rhodoblastus alkanivorans]MCI4679556.1 8-amino-7-oxononanoate synthase [Candidatus Rhodoblastus alkanivorans]MCI4683307.1 8-amino-7-oxononanoate synthase [Candidatus Rhodoblastus alkanivorans]MDI4640620.1 8-amino-7-oxononanoate synthase [Rhodoblastus acidophilus]
MAKTPVYRAYCDARTAQNRLRALRTAALAPAGRIVRDGRELVNFASNDYLGLSQHPALIEAACAYAKKYGAGVAASRLVTGENPEFAALEARIAAAKNQPAALVMAAGYQTNLTALAALADPEITGRPTTILADRLAHHSLLQGALLSGARLMRFQHNDCDHLEKLLRARTAKGEYCVIVTESVFGMDGDIADLARIGALAREFAALLYVDEAHATGVFGARGYGLCEDFADLVDVAMGTFGKALGGFGSYLACGEDIRDFLIQRCGGLVYSTGLPPATLGAIDAALTLVPQMERERQDLLARGRKLRAALRAQGWNCGASASQIVPVIVGAEEETLALGGELERRGLLVAAIRPPTVPQGASRLRISLSAAHALEEIDALIAALAEFAPQYGGAAA